MKIEPTDQYLDINVKAICANPSQVEAVLLKAGARYIGEDFQTDTFYNTEVGKLKLREGNIENLITHYLREEKEGAWHTKVFAYEKFPSDEKKRKLLGDLKPLGRITKRRKIFFIDNVKFHIDTFEDGKCFVEIEAIDKFGELGAEKIRQQANYYKQLLSIRDQDILTKSYIDLFG